MGWERLRCGGLGCWVEARVVRAGDEGVGVGRGVGLGKGWSGLL